MDGYVKVLLFVAVGTAAMLLPMSIAATCRKVRIWKAALIALYAAICGTVSAYLWFLLENQFWGGISFFGAVFLVPLGFLLVPRLFRESHEIMMDIFAPGICMMLAIMKVQCLTSGCCQGREICLYGIPWLFPSQLAELINGLLLMVILLIMVFRKKHYGELYPWFMILYGVTRFVLQFFREEWVSRPSIWPNFGTIWSALSLAIGILWLYLRHKKLKIRLFVPRKNKHGDLRFKS